MVDIIKKDGTREPFDEEKIIKACKKAAVRTLHTLTNDEINKIIFAVREFCDDKNEFGIEEIHNIVETSLESVNKDVANCYRAYRNYKIDFVKMLDDVYQESQRIMYIGDKENANSDSALVSTKRSLVFNQLNKELYKKFFLTKPELQAIKDGYIYIHDMSARRDTMNCFSKETKFITSDGIRSFEDYNDGDVVYVPTHTGEWKEAVVHSYDNQKLQKVIFRRGSRGEKTVYCTKNHRWLLKNGSETTNLSIGDYLQITPDISQIEWDIMSNEEKKWWVYGFTMADGVSYQHKLRNGKVCNSFYSNIRLCGRKNEYEELFIDAGFTVTHPKSLNGDGMVYIPSFNKNKFTKDDIPHEFIKFFINGWLSADGNKNLTSNPSSKWRSLCVSGNNNSFIYDMLNIAGYYVTRIEDYTGQETNFGKRTKETKNYGFYSNQGVQGWKVIDIQETSREETVWCLEVKDNHSFILENGIVTGNCCLANITNILSGGFEMGNIWYNEPKTLDVAFDVIGDITLSMASQQYGGFTLPEVDKILKPYAEKTYQKYYEKYINLGLSFAKANETAKKDLETDFKQGFQGWEYKFNTVASSRGDYPFITMTFGLGKSEFEQMASICALDVRMKGQGKEGYKKPVLFPKLVFLYDKELHDDDKELHEVFKKALECSSTCMYPDFLSLTGEGYVPSMYKKYGRVVSPMGCRAFLSPWFEKGGMKPLDESDKPVFVGRFNIGAISLHLPMILAKAREENKDFYDVLDYYLEMIRQLHIRTYEYLGEMRASINPLGFCFGGFYGGNLNFGDKIKPVLKSATASFGITALNELQELYNGKSLVEDGQFALDVMEYINKKVVQYKEEDGNLYAIYGTPAESLCSKQIEQFRKKYGIIEKVSDRPYVSNSFHCHVTEDISPIEKQDLEGRFWNMLNGGKIQYVRYPINYNNEAVETLVKRAMELGYYEGINLSLAYCDDCGHEELEMDVCPNCGSKNLTKIDRMNGYLAYSRVHGQTRLNDGKMAEIAERKSM